MKILFVRHGEADFGVVDQRGYIGMGRQFAPLTELGKEQTNKVAENSLFSHCEVIVWSPYTRALQTAAAIARKTGLEINVEADLHEFVPDKTYQANDVEEEHLLAEFIKYRGEHNGSKRWETISEMIFSTKSVLDRYVDEGYKKIIVVTHCRVIQRYTGTPVIGYCEVQEADYGKSFHCYEWV